MDNYNDQIRLFLNDCNKNKITRIQNIIIENPSEIVSEIINGKDRNGLFPLLMTCSNGRALDLELISLLLDNGAHLTINDKDKDGDFPLLNACYNSMTNPEIKKQIIELFLENNAHLTINDKNNNGDFPLLNIIKSKICSTDTVQILLDYGANVNQTNNKGETALFESFKSKNYDVTRLLLRHGANDYQNSNGDFPLLIACKNNDNHLVKLILEEGGEITKSGVSEMPIDPINPVEPCASRLGVNGVVDGVVESRGGGPKIRSSHLDLACLEETASCVGRPGQ